METKNCYMCDRDVPLSEWDVEQDMCTTCVPKQTAVCYYCGKRYPTDYFTLRNGENCCDDCFGPDDPAAGVDFDPDAIDPLDPDDMAPM